MTHPTSTDAPAPFRRAFLALLAAGRDLLGRVQAAIVHADTTHLPRRFAANPPSAERRIARTLDWIVALARTLAGDRSWLITPTYRFPSFPGRYPAFTAELRAQCGLPALPPRTEAQRAAAHRRYVRRVFATQPVAKIAARLARRLDIAPSADAWPADLCAITQTPVAWAKAHQSPPAAPPPSFAGTAPAAQNPTQTAIPPDTPRSAFSSASTLTYNVPHAIGSAGVVQW